MPVPDSELHESTTELHDQVIQYAKRFFPLTQGKLKFYQLVMSPVVNIETPNRNDDDYRFPITLTLDADVLYLSNKTSDYCLAKYLAKTKQWHCATRTLL